MSSITLRDLNSDQVKILVPEEDFKGMQGNDSAVFEIVYKNGSPFISQKDVQVEVAIRKCRRVGVFRN